jgi:hypothetical protein
MAGAPGRTCRASVTPAIRGRLARRWTVLGEPQEPGEPPLAVAGVPLLPDPIPRASGPGGVHRLESRSLGITPRVPRVPTGTGSHQGVART